MESTIDVHSIDALIHAQVGRCVRSTLDGLWRQPVGAKNGHETSLRFVDRVLNKTEVATLDTLFL